MSCPLVSIIVLNWNGKDLISDCLDSIQKLHFTDKEIIVVDNGSGDGSDILAEKFPVQLIRLKKNIGYAAGNNVGFTNAAGKYVVTLNNDITVDPDFLENPIRILESNPGTGIVSCRQMSAFQPDRIDALYSIPTGHLLFRSMGEGRLLNKSDQFAYPGFVIGANGATAIYRKSVLDQLAGFDERFFAYHEESDLCMRAFLHGWNCYYCPDAVGYHRKSASFGKDRRTFRYFHERNRWWFIYKNFPAAKIIAHMPLILLMEARLIRVAARESAAGAYLRSRRDGIGSFHRFSAERKEATGLFSKRKHRYHLLAKHKKLDNL